MADISVNEYVRTKLGIAKVEHYEDDIPHHTIWYTVDRSLDHVCFLVRDTEVIKHSFNLIDLIEAGDYVNGHLVVDVDNINTGVMREVYCEDDKDMGLWNEDIETIVTKEQFKSMEYKVGEEYDK